MGSITVSVEFTEETREGSVYISVVCGIEEDGETSPAVRRLANMLSEQMKIAVKAAATTMNEVH